MMMQRGLWLVLALAFLPHAGQAAPADAGAPEASASTVKLKLDIYPKGIKGVVMWGRKRIAVLGAPAKKGGPGPNDPIVFEQPRASGPLDLVIKAEGFLDHHTRLFTDRDDRLTVQLVKPGAAGALLGGKAAPP